jgi:DNA-binding beta-propeller fold protein YncE
MVHGGEQPISGAHIYLYAATTSGYNGASTSLLTSASGTSKDGSSHYYVTTASDGTFSISGDYTCPDASTQVYLYAIGGDSIPSVPNPAAVLMAGLGSCDGPNFSKEYIVVNEVSTIATAYALAGFAKDATDVSSSGSALATMGLADAFSTIANLETLPGFALTTTPAGNGTVPQSEINTLANILAACINTNGAVTGPTNPTPCYTLFSNAMNGASMPIDTANAAINIAHNPGANVAGLCSLQTPSSPFQPSLPCASPNNLPNDFTIAINYTGGGMDGSGFAPEGIAVDGLGNVWVPNFLSNSVSELNPLGAPISGPSGFTSSAGYLNGPTGISFDLNYNAWIASLNNTTMTEINRNGTILTTPPPYFTGAGLSDPYGVAIFGSGTTSFVWVTNNGGNSLSEFEGANGLELSGNNGFQNVDVTAPAGVAVDTSGNVWYLNVGSTASLGEAIPSTIPGSISTYNAFTDSSLNSPYSIAIDGSGNIWVTNKTGNGGIGSLSEYSPSQTKWLSPDPDGFTGGGIDTPFGLAIDGGGNVWTANNGGNSNSVSEFNSSGVAISGANGYAGTGLFPTGVAIDPSGNVWVANNSASGGIATAPLTEFVGAGVPVVTPLAEGAGFDQLGTKP